MFFIELKVIVFAVAMIVGAIYLIIRYYNNKWI
jgi:hypothetical protein